MKYRSIWYWPDRPQTWLIISESFVDKYQNRSFWYEGIAIVYPDNQFYVL